MLVLQAYKCWGEKAWVQGSANHTHNNNNILQGKDVHKMVHFGIIRLLTYI